MGTSLTDYGPLEFWAGDGIVQGWLLVLVEIIDTDPTVAPWMREARDHWRLQATVAPMRCLDLALNRLLAGSRGREAEFLVVVGTVRDRLHRHGAALAPEVVEQQGPAATPGQAQQIVDLLLRFTDAVGGLVRGQVAWQTDGRVPGVWSRTPAAT